MIANGAAGRQATKAANECMEFFEAKNTDVLWVTFFGGSLYWGFLAGPPTRDKSTMRAIEGSWRNTDLKGKPLLLSGLPGSIVATGSYRGTSCKMKEVAYLVNRINGQNSEIHAAALAARNALRAALVPLIQRLSWRDFEILVELVFAKSGWQRVSAVGGAQETIDIELKLPSFNDRAGVQIKGKASNADVRAYLEKVSDHRYEWLYFVHHTGDLEMSKEDSISVLGPEQVAAMALDAGLTEWIIEKAA